MNLENENGWRFIRNNNQLIISGDNKTEIIQLNGINSDYLGIYDGDG